MTEGVPADIHARLSAVEASVRELVGLSRERARGPEEPASGGGGRTAELEEAMAALRQDRDRAVRATERAEARIAALEAQVADLSGDLAERDHALEELQQALRYERDLRTLREAERDRMRELFSYLQTSRWRRLGQAIGVVKTREWEHIADE